MKKVRVVITGLGVVAPNGIGKETFWQALLAGQSGIRTISSFDASALPTRIAGEVVDFTPEKFMDSKKARRLSRCSQLAIASARMAFQDAGLQVEKLKADSVAVIFGVSTSAMDLIERQHRLFLARGVRAVTPFSIVAATPHSTSGEVAAELGFRGSLWTMATGCAAGLDSIGLGFLRIASGEAVVVVAGGADAPITPLILAGLSATRIMSIQNDFPEKASRPFDRMRDGGVLSEGSSAVILEEYGHALARGAKPYAEVVGYADASESDLMSPGVGLEKAMSQAIQRAKLLPENIGHISAHAPSDPVLDRIETEAIKKVFKDWAYRVPLTSIKSMVGNPFAAIGGMQVTSAALTFSRNLIPPTINYECFDPECDLDCTPNQTRFCRPEYILINA
ncbi:MAG: beta-ketoacyl-[acyl-carrier-protein] synthase family protein, partial [Candidatus Omnitrophica bacterium]|nr:beta-ketoacyl-[acyl-carrier-protein] synthase family protein [Candidatus Omnitrophota bacterium]